MNVDTLQRRLADSLQRAEKLLQSGHGRQAEVLCRKMIEKHPDSHRAWHLLGLIAHQAGNHTQALDMIQRAIRHNRSPAAYINNAGLVLESLGRLDQALDAFRHALRISPDTAQTFTNIGNILFKKNDLAAAIEHYQRAVRTDPGYAEAWYNLGFALSKIGHIQAAIENYRKAIHAKPAFADALFNLGNLLFSEGQAGKAIEYFHKTVALQPTRIKAWNNLGSAFKALGELDRAIDAYQQALRIRPDFPQARFNLGLAMHEKGFTEEAAANYRKAIQANPKYAQAHNNLGNILKDQGLLLEALAQYQSAVQINPDYAEAWYNIGVVCHDQAEFDAALAHYQKATAIKPDYAEAHCNQAFIYLLKGDFTAGWRAYEWRLSRTDRHNVYPRQHDAPRWNGEPLEGKRLLVHYEQGLGDTLQFVRYMPMLKALGGTVFLETQLPLAALLNRFPGVDALLTERDSVPPAFDYVLPLLSCPKIFKTELGTVPGQVPYIQADPRKIEAWRPYFDRNIMNIGIVWAGRALHPNDRNRSCSLQDFARLAGLPGIRLHGLQKGDAAQQAKQVRNHILNGNLGSLLNDFSDTAAVLSHLDLIISVDTAVVHLAGAMAKPVWTLLPVEVDWRWMQEQQDSPWYPTMRLFRQQISGDWTSVFDQVIDALSQDAYSGKNIQALP